MSPLCLQDNLKKQWNHLIQQVIDLSNDAPLKEWFTLELEKLRPDPNLSLTLQETHARLRALQQIQRLLTRIPQITSHTLARNLRHTPTKQGYSANSCHADRGTRWVTAKTRIYGSVLTAD